MGFPFGGTPEGKIPKNFKSCFMQNKHLNLEQRYTIERMLKHGHSKKEIFTVIGVGESTLYRELRRNCLPRGGYNAKHAQMLADERRREGHVKKHFTKSMESYVVEKLTRYQWSPEQIVGRARLEGIEMVSHERIYQFIWAEKSNGGGLHKHLRTGSKKYRKRYAAKSSRGHIPGKVNISERPKIVDQRTRVGDFESDLIIGKGHKGALLTIVDRYSGMVLVENVGGKRKDAVKKATINALAPFRAHVHTITNDNGKEFAEHLAIAKKLDCQVFFANPYASWERGLSEYTNKLLRQYFPKQKELDGVTQKQILNTMELLNNRPRKKLGYRTPNEVFFKFINQNTNLALAG